MTPEQAQEVCAVLFITACRDVTEPLLAIWERALTKVDDRKLDKVVDHLIAHVDFGTRGAPTPAMFLAARRIVLNLPEPVFYR